MDEQQFERFVQEVTPLESVTYWLTQFEQAKSKQIQAMINVALLYKQHKNYDEMYALLDEATLMEDPYAFYELANCYFELLGNRGNEQLAFELYERAALLDHADAMNNLADMYFNGEGTEVDERKAFEWFTKAAHVGVAEAKYTLGIMYEQGIGTDQSDEFALQHYEQSAIEGYAEAMYRMGMIYFTGELGQKQNTVHAFDWFLKAAEQFHVDAIFNVAYCYEMGDGTTQNEENAIHYYKQASLLGDYEASNKLAGIYELRKSEQANKWRKKAIEQLNNEEM